MHVQHPGCNLQHIANLTAMCVIMNLTYSMEELDTAVANMSNTGLSAEDLHRTRTHLAALLDTQLHETAGLIAADMESLGVCKATSTDMGREIQKLVRFHAKNKVWCHGLTRVVLCRSYLGAEFAKRSIRHNGNHLQNVLFCKVRNPHLILR